MNIGGIVLAAGHSSRFGDGHKLLASLDGVPLLRRATAALSGSSEISDIVVVLPPEGDALAAVAGVGRWRYVANRNAADGMATSLRCGLAALGKSVDGALIALADMPLLTAGLVTSLTAEFRLSEGRAIVFPQDASGRQGHPVIWPSLLFGELNHLSGDHGGKSILMANRQLWAPVATGTPDAFIDIDTIDDLRAAETYLL